MNSLINKNKSLLLNTIKGNLKIIDALLIDGADINTKNKNGDTALMLAVQRDNSQIVNLLLTKGANVNSSNEEGNNAVILATISNQLEIINNLLEFGANINHKNKNGDTPLILAVKDKNLHIVKKLIKLGANINYQNQYGNTALICATAKGDLPIVNTLLTQGADINVRNDEDKTALIYAKEKSHIKIENILNIFLKIKVLIIKFYQEFEKQITKKNNSQQLIIDLLSAFQEQIEKNNTNQTLALDIMQFLKKEFINNLYFEEENYSLLHIAVLHNWEKLVIHLVNKWPINVDYEDTSGNSPWNYACLLLQKQNPFIVKKYNFQLTAKDKKFLKENIDLCKNQFAKAKKENDITAAKNRLAIINYYKDNNIIYYKEEINAIDLEQKLQIFLTNENKPTI